MSNFSGHVKKNARSFVPRSTSGAPEVGIVRNVAGTYEPMSVIEVKKANEPTLPTTATPPTDGRGEAELGLSGQVSHGDNDGSTRYLLETIKRVYRQTLAGRDADALSLEERRALRDQIYYSTVYNPQGGLGEGDTKRAIYELASLLAGLQDELSNTPDFLRAPKPPTPDSDRVGRIGSDYLRLKADSGGTLIKSAGESISVFVPILRKDASKRLVYGIAAQEEPDKAGEVMDYASSKQHFAKWAAEAYERTSGTGASPSYGNLRAQHSPTKPVGKLVSIDFDDDRKAIPVVAHVVDDDAWAKVAAGVYTGFSIGGRYLNKWADGSLVRYTAQPAEISLVDSPCIPGAIISAIKSAPQTALDKIVADMHKTTEMLTAHVKKMLEAQGANLEELNPTRFKTMHEWREAIAKAELAKALANGQPATFEGGHTKSGFRPLDTGEAPSGEARTHYSDLPVEKQRRPFQPRG